MGSYLTGCRDFIEFIQASGKGLEKGAVWPLLGWKPACPSQPHLLGRSNWASSAPEPRRPGSGDSHTVGLWTPLLLVLEYEVCSAGYSCTIFLLLTNELNIHEIQQREPVSEPWPNADSCPGPGALGALWCSRAMFFIFSCYQNYVTT